MRVDLLKASEAQFFARYPLGFEDPEMLEIRKRHQVDKMHKMALEYLCEERFSFVEEVLENIIKITTRSSLVSVFEKPKFRDFMKSLSSVEKEIYVNGLKEFLHGDQAKGFHMMIDILDRGKLAKWSLLTVCFYYYYPQTEVFIKPTTAKGIIDIFEFESLVYKPRPTYDFYVTYRERLMEFRKRANPAIAPDNAAFSGFLMMAMEQFQ